ncbi:MAG TPA: alpha/beta hydrolase, partial [Phycisphaerae bacterium]
PAGKFVGKFYSHVAPGIDGEFDGPSIIPLIAPRPLMAINGDKDPRTPGPGLKLATDAIEAAYRKAGAEEHFLLRLQANTAHQVRPESQTAAEEWFVRWLKP